MADDLYDRDFYLWTRAQAEALRARDRAGNAIDFDRVAEEIEDLGSAQKNAVRSYVRNIIVHLMELDAGRQAEPRGHWMVEVAEFRAAIDDMMTTSIRRLVDQELEALHQKAAPLAERKMRLHEPDVQIDPAKRWTLPQILGEAEDPLETGDL